MITTKHWFSALSIALLLHAVAIFILLPKHRPEVVVMNSSAGGGIDVGIAGDGDSDNEITANEVAEISEPQPAQVAPVKQPPVVNVNPVVESKKTTVNPVEPQVEELPVAIETFTPVNTSDAVLVAAAETPKTNDAVSATISSPLPVADVKTDINSENLTDKQYGKKHHGSKIGSRHGGNGSGKGSGNSRALQAYFSNVSALIDANKDYPGEVKKEKQEGMVVVAFSINRKGELLSAAIHKSSGYALLDKAALATLQRSSPFPKIPKSIKDDHLKIAVPIAYTLIKN